MNNNNNENVFENFQKKLYTENVQGTNLFEKDILKHYDEILKIISTSFESYRENVPKVLSSLETNNSKSLSYSIFIFINLLKELKNKEVIKLDLSRFRNSCTDATYEKYIVQLEASISANNRPRVSEFTINTDSLTIPELEQICSLIIDIVEEKSKMTELSEADVNLIVMQLPPLRAILKQLNNIHIFYLIVGQFIDRLNTSEFFQIARNTAEEVILCSFIDNIPEYGFYEAYACYANQGSTQSSLLYANLSLMCFKQRTNQIYDRFLEQIISTSIKYFRNINGHDIAIDIYKNYGNLIISSNYQKRSLDHTYFTCLLNLNKKELAFEVADYLDLNRESIINGGSHDATPWLILLYNIKRIQHDNYIKANQLNYYLNIFSEIVPKEVIERYSSIIFGDSTKLRDVLKRSLIKLNETVYKSDLSYDNEMSLTIASRAIEGSFALKDSETILIAMMIKSDFSLMFKPKLTEVLAEIKIPEENLDNFNKIYSDIFSEIKKASIINSKIIYIWLCYTEGKYFELLLNNGKFEHINLTEWNSKKLNELVEADFFSTLRFDVSIKSKYEVRAVLPEEHEQEAEIILKRLETFKIQTLDSIDSIFIVKDMDLSKFPHNLLLSSNGTFLAKTNPITNILSSEWYLSELNKPKLSLSFTKSIWIPCGEENFEFHQLYSTLEDTLVLEKFNIDLEVSPKKPLDSLLNIVCSHGAKDIAINQFVYPGANPFYDLDKVIGDGKILIFFVCHSGSYQNEF